MNPMDKDKLTTIFFDAGGVLFKTSFQGAGRIKQILQQRGFNEDSIHSALQKADEFSRTIFNEEHIIATWEDEKSYWEQYYGLIATELGDELLSHELFVCTHFVNHCELFPEVKDVLELLGSKYRLGVISNAFPSMDWAFDRLGIRAYFQPLILSAFANTSKPKASIYHLAVKKANTYPEESLFIDDLLVNVEGARQIGMHALHLKRDIHNLKQLLQHHQIL